LKKSRFALIGAAGYIAPRHMQAIKENQGSLSAALDPNDSVGIIDNYFPEASFFTEFERFDRHLEKLKHKHEQIDFLSVCSPNHLHDAHIRFGLRHGADVICEKPIVINPWNIDALERMEKESGKRIYNILQLRLHENVIALKKKVEEGPQSKVYDIDLTYQTSRGNWYYTSWKGDQNKSGGIATNIGVHFFDILSWIFGPIEENIVHLHTHDRAAGFLGLKQARVRWFLSINYETLPEKIKATGQRVYRSMSIDGDETLFTKGFDNLHTKSYNHIMNGKGFSVQDAKNAITTAFEIRNKKPIGVKGDYHPFASKKLIEHPFSKK